MLDNSALRDIAGKKLATPDAKRRAVHLIREQLGLSERRACDSRSTPARELGGARCTLSKATSRIAKEIPCGSYICIDPRLASKLADTIHNAKREVPRGGVNAGPVAVLIHSHSEDGAGFFFHIVSTLQHAGRSPPTTTLSAVKRQSWIPGTSYCLLVPTVPLVSRPP